MDTKEIYFSVLSIFTFIFFIFVHPISPEFIPTMLTYLGLGVSLFLIATTFKSKEYKLSCLAAVLLILYGGTIALGFKTFTLSEFIHLNDELTLIAMSGSKSYTLITWIPDETKDITISNQYGGLLIEGGRKKEFLSNLQNVEASTFWRPNMSSSQQLASLKISEESFMFSLSPIDGAVGSLRYYKNSGYGNNKEYDDKLLISEDLFSYLPDEIQEAINTIPQ